MKSKILCGVAAWWCLNLSGVFLGVLPAFGTQTKIWTLETAAEFERGELDQLALTAEGELMLSPRFETVLKLTGKNMIAWALAEDSAGNIYVGTGDQGQVLKIEPDGDVSTFFDSPEIAILSLAVDADDTVYAGSAPSGVIYKLTPDGSQTAWVMTGEHYVWSLVFDRGGNLYAGTGDAGKIFKITPDGGRSVLYDSPQAHVMALVHDVGGWLYAGTEGKGITYKIGLDGSVFALHDAKEQEIRALTTDSMGNLYIAAISSQFFPQAQAQGQAEPPAIEAADKSASTSTIYRITPAGTVTTVVTLPEVLIYAMTIDQDDQLLVGADTKGRLYRVDPATRSAYRMLALDAGKISALWRSASGQVYAGTSDSGSVARIAARLAEQGTYLSPVHDAAGTATWGKIFWRGSGSRIVVQTRTGNTAVPDDTWSPWSKELTHQIGEAIPGPAARFVQWKAILKRADEPQDSPLLEEVSVAFLPHNLAPEVSDVRVFYPDSQGSSAPGGNSSDAPSPAAPSGSSNARKPDAKASPPASIPPGYVAIGWQAQDPNQDRLQYTVSLRGEHESRWKTIQEDVTTTGYMLDTRTLADGGYYVKITASDLLDNPPDRALTGERVSKRFEIDNTPPEVLIALNQRKDGASDVVVTVLAQDEASRLTQAEYALNGGEWIPIFPDDAVADSREEKYSIPLKNVAPDEEQLIVFRVMDSYRNIGVGKFVFALREELAPAETDEEE